MPFNVKVKGEFYSVSLSDAFLVMDLIRALPKENLENVYPVLEKHLLKTGKENTPSNGFMDFDAMQRLLSRVDITYDCNGKETHYYHRGVNEPKGKKGQN